jgi:hypothetical protein
MTTDNEMSKVAIRCLLPGSYFYFRCSSAFSISNSSADTAYEVSGLASADIQIAKNDLFFLII